MYTIKHRLEWCTVANDLEIRCMPASTLATNPEDDKLDGKPKPTHLTRPARLAVEFDFSQIREVEGRDESTIAFVSIRHGDFARRDGLRLSPHICSGEQ
jgi:hypothetical protein